MIAMNEDQWKDKVKGILKAELAKRNINYVRLSELLQEKGIQETPQNLSNKIGRGTFGAVFMFQILETIGCEEIRLA